MQMFGHTKLEKTAHRWLGVLLAVGLVFIPDGNVAGQVDGGQSQDPSFAKVGRTDGGLSLVIASVKPADPSDRRFRLGFTPEGYSAENVSLLKIVQDAYGIYEQDRIVGYPSWVSSQKFTIDAKVDSTDLGALSQASLHERQDMLQKLLADRFELTTHTETREMRIYSLVVTKRGPKLQEAKSGYISDGTFKGFRGTVRRSSPGHLEVEGFTMGNFALFLARQVGHHVDDRTGLAGFYDFSLDWAADEMASQPDGVSSGSIAAPVPSGPSIYDALKEQLGLELSAAKGPVSVLVVDQVAEPSPN